jgi:biotin synthase
MRWNSLSEKVLSGGDIDRDEALAVLKSSDDELFEIFQAAFDVRRHYFGRDVRLHVIRNAKSGNCGEDCGFCSQAAKTKSMIRRFPMQTAQEIIDGARQAHRMKAVRYCIVTSGRAARSEEIELLCEAVQQIKREIPILICTSLGLIDSGAAQQLSRAGVDRYNHNLETSERYFPSICTTHSYTDRLNTAKAVKEAGLELCCGGIIGLGESLEDRIDLAFALRDLDADSIPVNFYDPRPGTRFGNREPIGPVEALRSLAVFRLVNPDREIRAAGGREACLGAMQVLALFLADSIFTAGYLTTDGLGYEADIMMIRAAGFQVTEVTEAG